MKGHMPDKIVVPKFLTTDLARIAVTSAVSAAIRASSQGQLEREGFHIIILVPSVRDFREMDGSEWLDRKIYPHLLYEESVGNTETWTGEYDNIARSKAIQLWNDRNDGGSDILPHLMFPCDTPYWGGVKRNGIVVTCSGVQPWFDRMISGLIADLLIGLAYNAWMTSDDKEKRVDFLT